MSIEPVIIGRAKLYLGDCRDILPGLGKVDAVVTDLAAGTAAEHLVCADLLLCGYRAFLADQNCAYDIAVDVAGRLIRIQVKAQRGWQLKGTSNFIGIEREPRYFEIACKRIEEAQRQGDLFIEGAAA